MKSPQGPVRQRAGKEHSSRHFPIASRGISLRLFPAAHQAWANRGRLPISLLTYSLELRISFFLASSCIPPNQQKSPSSAFFLHLSLLPQSLRRHISVTAQPASTEQQPIIELAREENHRERKRRTAKSPWRRISRPQGLRRCMWRHPAASALCQSPAPHLLNGCVSGDFES